MIARYERKEHGLKMRHIYEVVKGDDAESSVKVNNKLTWVGDFYPVLPYERGRNKISTLFSNMNKTSTVY